MTSTQIRLDRLFVAGLLLSALAACGGGGGKTTPPPPPVVTVAQEDKFGVRFGTAFRAGANSEPYSPSDGDIIAVSLTTEPESIN